MTRIELQNNIIRLVLNTNDNQLLDYLNSILSKGANSTLYKLSDFEKTIINESLSEYKAGKVISNEDVFSKNEKWLEE
jgi:hypothetical protein